MLPEANSLESLFHSIIRRWFAAHFREPTPPQESGWRAIAAGESTLIAAPTGSGKTLAAFLWSIDRLFKRAAAGALDDATSVVYVSPLKALGNDIAKNLQAPLGEILKLAWSEGLLLPDIRVAVRTGDTPAHERQAMVRRPPHILITTPESLYILLTAARSRGFLKAAETVIVDEIHAVAADKRGAHLAVSLERLDDLVGRRLQRIGLSATQNPIEEVARLLVGTEGISPEGKPRCAIVNAGHRRALDLQIELPDQELGPIVRHEIWAELFDKIASRVKAHRTTLVFVNTRRLVERVAHQLSERLGEANVGAHHGSLSRKTRLEVEGKLKSGGLPVVVATASLELGIDIGHVDVVCHIGSARSIGVLLQRVGRSGHWLDAMPKGILYPLTRDDLLECAALIRAVRAGELDRLAIVEKPLDILAQQMVATVAASEAGTNEQSAQGQGIEEEALWRLMRRAYPYRDLGRGEFDQVLEMLSEGIAASRSRRSAYIHRDRIHRMLRPRRGARLAAMTNGGAIPDTADYDVIEFPDETFVGKVNEDFAVESLAGDIFLLGNRSWRIRRVSSGKVLVEDAQGLAPTIPFWLGEGPGRTLELSRAVSNLRREVAARRADRAGAREWLEADSGIPAAAAEQIVDYIRDTAAVLGIVPTQEQIVAERFFDESGGMQLIIHSPWGGRINRAWGLALRKRFCVSFDRELQAAATDDGICISLVEQHSFPLADVFLMLPPRAVEPALTQASLASPMFTNRWRWNAGRALALLRQIGGKKIPVAIQRMRAEDLLAAVFPQQVMCQENQAGPIPIPDHPLVNETLRDCLHEAMDTAGLKEIVAGIERGSIETVCVDTPAPSPMAHEILNANPYAFLDDAPLEERRARAVSLRRVDPWLDREFGQLDPAAIAEVRRQAWPDVRNPDELHDLLLDIGILPLEQSGDWADFAEKLIAGGRATTIGWPGPESAKNLQGYVAAERWSWIEAILPEARQHPTLHLPNGAAGAPTEEGEVLTKIVHGWMEITGPTTIAQLALTLGLPPGRIGTAMLALETSGSVLRGQYSGEAQETEWCERGLLARIHRLTIGRMRKEIEPVSAAEFMKFLISWQHAARGSQLRGREGVLQIIRQLQGMELPAHAWEQHVLPARVENYDPADLEQLCLSGAVAWGRLRSEMPDAEDNPVGRPRRARRPNRRAPLAFMIREERDYFVDRLPSPGQFLSSLSPLGKQVAEYLAARGASFLSDIARGAGLLKVKAEEALWELVARGVATGDGVSGLRVLLTPEKRRFKGSRRLRLINGGQSERLMPIGRWSLWRVETAAESLCEEEINEHRARQLLQRYGVVFREVVARENSAPPWRLLQQIYRRLEARGEIRGGRFIAGFAGEQFALPAAVDRLRAERRSGAAQEPVVIAAADPLNLMGILSPGARLSPYAPQAIVYSDGKAVEFGPLGSVRSKLHRGAAAGRPQDEF